jgi:non-heme chloroperoxidase
MLLRSKNTLPELRIASLDGTELAVVSNGKTALPAIIFIHGTCSSLRIWDAQFTDPILNDNFHLIAFDLRGHGNSDKPTEAQYYFKSDRWAGDLHAIIEHFSLVSVFLVAWSYGGRVVNDYLQVHGDAKIRAINFIAAGTLSTDSVKGPGYKVLAELFDHNTQNRERAELQFVEDLTQGLQNKLIAAQMFSDLAKVSLPIRLNMRNRQMHYEQTLANLQVPVLLSHGKKDNYSLPLLAILLEKHIPDAQISWYQNDGHLPFISSASRFNSELAKFVLQFKHNPNLELN